VIDTRDFASAARPAHRSLLHVSWGLSTTSIYFQQQDIARDECNPPGHVLS
jgi:hypothetical protein